MAATTRLRSIDTANLVTNPSPPCSSPTKRMSTSPALDTEGNPRVLRTKLSSAEEDDGLVGGSSATPHDPSTPPEYIDASTAAQRDLRETDRNRSAVKDEGATQTATAERQTRELGRLPYHAQNMLARLCSQHPGSEYNSLKKAVAAAAPGLHHDAQLAQSIHPPMPPLRHSQTVDPFSFTTTSRPAPPPRAPSAGPLATPQPLRGATAVPRSPRSHVSTPPPRSTLTPSLARVNFEFSLNAQPTISASPIQVEQRSAAETTVAAILDDLVEGEPVSVERTTTKVVVSETVPTASLPIVSEPVSGIHGLLPGMLMMNGAPVKTSLSHPINISPLIPPELLAYYSSRLFSASRAVEQAAVSRPVEASLADLIGSSPTSFLLEPRQSCDLLTLITPVSNGVCPVPPHSSVGAPQATDQKIGNFVLSSCPGKKVRMNGESLKGGRGAICRDVKLDLKRAKDEGVRMVVCCLDDSELAFLGTPFPEYSAACEALDIRILRIPMVEGFAPASPASLDAQLDRLIRNHTLRGEGVLAHCRGGIGRAGLVASCWMIKMGMVSTRYGFGDLQNGVKSWKEEDPIVIVERVIDLIRKRRSVKSIETTHQVKFLVEYIEYLQHNARIVSATELAQRS
ncbi:hypothetical protein JCM11491_002069 [Sporobolomyces phaffii]